MNASLPVLRITIKELVIEIEDERAVQQLGASLGALFGHVGSAAPEEVLLVTDAPRKRRGRPPKAKSAVKAEKLSRKRRPRSEAATARIRQMGEEGFFSSPRRAADVKTALTAGGYKLENRQVYATLKYMADKGILQRAQEGDDGNWTYQMAATGE
ncbi:MAG: hypothetical protein JNL34_17490 [Anaerolineae bacterium]|nr:hypothetical protein [Anaerolineae bacterium]